MKVTRVGTLTALAVALFAPAAGAQICAGFPTVDRQFSFGASLDFPEGGDRWGVEASYDLAGPLGVFGGLEVTNPDGEGDSFDTYHGGAAFTLLNLEAGLPLAVSVCPTAQLGYTDVELGSLIQVPIGLGFGTYLSVAPAIPLMPYAIPQIVMSRFEIDDVDSETEWDFGFRGGVLVGFGIVFVGGEINHTFVEGADPSFGIRGGIKL